MLKFTQILRRRSFYVCYRNVMYVPSCVLRNHYFMHKYHFTIVPYHQLCICAYTVAIYMYMDLLLCTLLHKFIVTLNVCIILVSTCTLYDIAMFRTTFVHI